MWTASLLTESAKCVLAASSLSSGLTLCQAEERRQAGTAACPALEATGGLVVPLAGGPPPLAPPTHTAVRAARRLRHLPAVTSPLPSSPRSSCRNHCLHLSRKRQKERRWTARSNAQGSFRRPLRAVSRQARLLAASSPACLTDVLRHSCDTSTSGLGCSEHVCGVALNRPAGGKPRRRAAAG